MKNKTLTKKKAERLCLPALQRWLRIVFFLQAFSFACLVNQNFVKENVNINIFFVVT